MIFNKKRRIKYLGFDDFWFVIIGLLILSFVTDFLFNNSFVRFPIGEALLNWSLSLFFTICDWFIIRTIIILLRKKYPDLDDDVKRLSLLFLAIIGTVILVDFAGNRLLAYIFGERYRSISPSTVLVPIIIISTMTMAIYEAIYYNIRLKKSIREEEQTKRAIVQAQLDTLSNQAQPHFLFNSLNTLRDIIDQNTKEDAKNFVDKLSDVYRFILDSGNDHLILLQDELKFAQSYVHIQSERFGDNLQLNWDVPKAALNMLIAPMSLQLLLENAIKHNIISRAKPLKIDVRVVDEHLIVKNKIQARSTQLPSTKLGLKNIKKRYKLISELPVKIKNDSSEFSVSIPLLRMLNQNNNATGINY